MSSDLLGESRGRLIWAKIIISLLASFLVLRLARWTVWPQTAPAGASADIWVPSAGESSGIYTTRGNILDRDGALLVTTGYRWDVSISPNMVSTADAGEVAEELAPFVDRSVEELTLMLQGKSTNEILGKVDYHTGLAIRALDNRATRLDPIPMRLYPEGTLAAHVLGFVNFQAKAFYGVENYHDAYLRGELSPDWSRKGKSLSQLGHRFEQNASPDGTGDLILTIDRAMQYRVEDILRNTVVGAGAAGGTIIVMDPKTGAILASASYPTYAPAEYWRYPSADWDDPAVSEWYEPGSIFKIVTMSAGLNSGIIEPDDTYVDVGYVKVGDEKITNLNQRAYGLVDMRDVLIYSINTGTAHVSALLGPENFYPYVERFGFGSKTGVDLGGEIEGDVHWYGGKEWHESDMVTNSFGQGLTVTPIQMITAVAAVANQGYLMQPHVAKGMISNGRVIEIEPRMVRQVIETEAARTVTEMLVAAVDEGIQSARVSGYSVAGKSGTAEIPDKGTYGEGTIAGFVGYLPASDPAMVILVKIVRPQGETLGSRVAGPVFSKLAEQLVAMAGIPPDRPEVQ